MTRRRRVVHVVRAALAMLAAIGPRAATAQVTTFDILSFVAPAGWARSERAGLVMWQRTGQTGNELWTCSLAVFESRPSSGNPGADFESDWLDLLKYRAGRETAESQDIRNGWTRLSRNIFSPAQRILRLGEKIVLGQRFPLRSNFHFLPMASMSRHLCSKKLRRLCRE